MIPEFIRIENRGRSTHLYVAGMRFSKSILGIAFNQSKDDVGSPELTVTVNLKTLLQEISEITPEQLETAKEIIKLYFEGCKRTATENSSSSMKVLR